MKLINPYVYDDASSRIFQIKTTDLWTQLISKMNSTKLISHCVHY